MPSASYLMQPLWKQRWELQHPGYLAIGRAVEHAHYFPALILEANLRLSNSPLACQAQAAEAV